MSAVTAPRPLLLGIVGDSGAGKSTLAGGILAVLGEERAAVLCLDDYHRYDRRERPRRGLTALDPACNRLDLALEHLRKLRSGETITRPTYDHSTGTFGPPRALEPRPTLIVYGLLGFHDELASAFDLRVFLDPDQELRLRWKRIRDTRERGYTPEEVRRQLELRRADSERFIRPQAARAHLVASFHPQPGYRDSLDNRQLNLRIRERPGGRGPTLRELAGDAERLAAREGGPPWVRLKEEGPGGEGSLYVDGGIPNRIAAEVEDELWRRVPELEAGREERPTPLGTFDEAGVLRHSNPLALAQILVACRLWLGAGGPEPARA